MTFNSISKYFSEVWVQRFVEIKEFEENLKRFDLCSLTEAWTGNFTRIEDILKILDQGDAEVHQKPREISNRRVGS